MKYCATIWGVVLFAASTGVQGGTLWQRVTAPYAAVSNASCEIRRDAPLPSGGTARMLSRVHFARGDRMHVETTAPLRRRIVCDGTRFRMYMEGAARGYGTTVTNLPADMLANLRSVPGSPEQALLALMDVPEVLLPPADAFPVRAGYDNGKTFTVLSLDDAGRLARIEVFENSAMQRSFAATTFSAYREMLPGVWFAFVQKTEVRLRGKMRTETLRISDLKVNGDLPAVRFDPDAFFTDIPFVDALEAMGE